MKLYSAFSVDSTVSALDQYDTWLQRQRLYRSASQQSEAHAVLADYIRELQEKSLSFNIIYVLTCLRSLVNAYKPLMLEQPKENSLSSIYANIRDQCSVKADGWPHTVGLLTNRYDAVGRPRAPVFDDGHGPIGAYSMLGLYNDKALCILRWAREYAFGSFVDELSAVLTTEQLAEWDEGLLFWNPEKSYHISITVFHEHPKFLKTDDEKWKWRDLSDASLRSRLIQALEKACTTELVSPRLTLDSLTVTSDGAMIACFVDDEALNFAEIKRVTASVARSVIGGDLTSRPKRLIHVTVGRLFGRPSGMTATQSASFSQIVRHYNHVVLPALVDSLRESASLEIEMSTLCFARDIGMERKIFYGTWDLSR